MKDNSAAKLLTYPVAEDYKAYWSELLLQTIEDEEEKKEVSLLVFRLHGEWLGISTHVFTEVVELRAVHAIPHRTNSILRGTVNFRGQLRLCVNLASLLEIEPVAQTGAEAHRMVAISQDKEDWIFAVNEIYGIIKFNINEIENVPVTVAKSKVNFLKGILVYDQLNIGYLEEELLFFSLKRALQ